MADKTQFLSFEEMDQWIRAAAEERGWQVADSKQGNKSALTVTLPDAGGTVTYVAGTAKDDEEIDVTITASDAASTDKGRELLKAAQALQDEA